MSGLAYLFAQLAAQAAPLPAPEPDIGLRARVQAREVTIEQQGRASARVYAEPSGGERIEVERNLPRGRSQYRNLALTVQIDARLANAVLGTTARQAPADENEPQGSDR